MAILSTEGWSEDNLYPAWTEQHFDVFCALDIDHDAQSHPDYVEYWDSIWNSSPPIGLALEQCCDDYGNLLPFAMRETRLQNAPFEIKVAVEDFLRATPETVRGYLILESFWLVRAERGDRTGKATI